MAWATYLLLAVNTAIYGILASQSATPIQIDRRYMALLGMEPQAFLGGAYWQVITSFFVHFDLPHLGYNMVFLAFFGTRAEELYGSRRILGLYLILGFFTSLASLLYPRGISAGASGAIFGLLGLVLVASRNLYPRGIWTSLLYGFVLFVLASATGLIAHLAGLVLGLAVGGWITRDWYPSTEQTEDEAPLGTGPEGRKV
ncbi:MAG: rhomboid family intramembrane serine protease [Euryarchaeota archaeon]|nr:rhomboid family intramembrane serine protease [Euryarchaeota archaeon]